MNLPSNEESGLSSVSLPDSFSDVTDIGRNAPPRLVVAPTGEWFLLEGSPLVNLATRASLRKLLVALASLRARDPDSELSVREAFAAGWPGDRAHPDAAAVRVYTAVHTLRALGLRRFLVRRSGGYALEIDVRIAAPESQFPHALLDGGETIARAV